MPQAGAGSAVPQAGAGSEVPHAVPQAGAGSAVPRAGAGSEVPHAVPQAGAALGSVVPQAAKAATFSRFSDMVVPFSWIGDYSPGTIVQEAPFLQKKAPFY